MQEFQSAKYEKFIRKQFTHAVTYRDKCSFQMTLHEILE